MFKKVRDDGAPVAGPAAEPIESEALPVAGGGRSIIGAHTRVRGTIRGSGSVLVRGAIEGEITIGGGLVVAEGGRMEADIEADSVDLAGEARGSLRAGARVAVSSTGQFEGELTTPVLDAQPGSVINGRARVAGVEPRGPLSR